jgi:hypothetical protein
MNSGGGSIAANVNLIRLDVSRTRTAGFNNRNRMVENSQLASAWARGIADWTVRNSQ